MRKHPLFSVVIPAYNEEKLLPLCLESLAQQKTVRKFEVIVVNNNSTDTTEKVAKKFDSRLSLKVILEKKKGRGAARHAGFKHARGKIILSTDADTILPPNWIESTAQAFENQTIVATTNPSMIQDCSWTQNTFFNFLMPLGMRVYRRIFGHYWLSGFGSAIRKEIYQKSGGFDGELNAMEDIELSFRVMKLGTIQCIFHSRPIFSGRRFKKGLIRGVAEYAKPFFAYLFLKRKSLYLDDVREEG